MWTTGNLCVQSAWTFFVLLSIRSLSSNFLEAWQQKQGSWNARIGACIVSMDEWTHVPYSFSHLWIVTSKMWENFSNFSNGWVGLNDSVSLPFWSLTPAWMKQPASMEKAVTIPHLPTKMSLNAHMQTTLLKHILDGYKSKQMYQLYFF